ncbi:MAG: YbaK/EbsC family protein [Solirubrobacteraceae bacterium]
MAVEDTYDRLIALLDRHGASYRLIEHAPEGSTEAVSELRGNRVAEAAKCIVLRVKVGKKLTRYVLAVIPGDRRVNLAAIKELLDGTYVGFVETETAERLAPSPTGTVLPFAFEPELELIVDPDLLSAETLYFNAARLDRSIALDVADYRRIAQPTLASIATAID